MNPSTPTALPDRLASTLRHLVAVRHGRPWIHPGGLTDAILGLVGPGCPMEADFEEWAAWDALLDQEDDALDILHAEVQAALLS